ncbi:hypothetical protein ACFPZI_08105 [Streptomyces chlorus]|uniref:Uncharacterized protein n=1 Tax=Streptomyces chlorus TaxID=887452 RepID=A0ABW1DUH3_9ACTN
MDQPSDPVLGGFYFGAQQVTQADALSRLADELARYTNEPSSRHWRGWEDAVEALPALGGQGPVPVVIDEFPHLEQSCRRGADPSGSTGDDHHPLVQGSQHGLLT